MYLACHSYSTDQGFVFNMFHLLSSAAAVLALYLSSPFDRVRRQGEGFVPFLIA